MPAFTEEELRRFAELDAIEHVNEITKSTGPLDNSTVTVGEVDGSDDVEMKHEIEPDAQSVPFEEDNDEQLKDEPAEVFAEAAEQMSSSEAAEPVDEQPETDGDVTMEDAQENQETVELAESESSEGDEQLEDSAADNHPDTQQDSSDSEEEAEDDNEEEDENNGQTQDIEQSDQTDSSSGASGSESASDHESESEEEKNEEDEEEDSEDDDADEEDTIVPLACSICNGNTRNGQSDFESCTKCGVYVHHKCAQDGGTMREEDDGSTSWQCQACTQTDASESPKDTSKRNRNSAPRLVRDLLPVSRGVQKPNSHSIFAQPLISEGEDGGRALRKRKSPTIEPPVSEKRRRRATPKALPTGLPDEARADSMVHATRRASHKSIPTARILQYRPYEKAPPHKFILAFRLDQSKIEKILLKQPRPGKRRDRRRAPKIPPPPIFQPPVPKFPALPTSHLIFPSMWSDRENEANAKPYGGILSDIEADTSRSLPQLKDRELFEIARKEAEEERRKTSAAAEAEINGENANIAKPNRTVSGPPSKIKCIQFGKHVIDTFYAAPYPEEYSHESRLFICEFCLKYLPSEFVAYRHKLKCPAKHPPGDEIYRDGTISIWEVDGRKKTEYCQCLCLMAKMFLGSKTLYYDVEPFLFYILTEYDEFGYHFVGYFSKEKRPASQNNVSCILVMPIHQRKGYATFLIDFSYLLTRIEGKDGSPEKPLSDMGLTAYRSYWDLTISTQLLQMGMKPFSTRDLMHRTGMTADDVVHSLERLYAFVKDPVTKTYAIRYDQKLYQNIVSDFDSKKYRRMKAENLIWTPYIMGRSDQAHLDTQPVQTIAPREGDEVVVEEIEIQPTETKDVELTMGEDDVSPKTSNSPPRQSPAEARETDPLLVNGAGVVAPGPPSAQLLTSKVAMHGKQPLLEQASDEAEEGLTGYALAFRSYNIPPGRFQIDPPIPASMLLGRSHKKRGPGRGRTVANGNSAASPAVLAPVRSSPRHAASVNGSVNGTTDTGSPEKPSTPVRRSSRKSGLSNMETIGLDGSIEPEEQEVGDEIEAKMESGSSSASSSGEEEEETVEEDEDDEEEDDDDAEVPDEDEEEDEDEDDEEADDDPDALDIVHDSDEDEESEDDD